MDEFTCAYGVTTSITDSLIKCHHLCNDCLFEALRNSIRTCTTCESIFSTADIQEYRSHKTLCESCRSVLYTVLCFIKKLCKHNLCTECLEFTANSFNGMCPVDLRPFPYRVGLNLRTLNSSKCVWCNSFFERMSQFHIEQNCGFELCEKCQFNESVDACAVCNSRFTEKLSLWLIKRRKEEECKSRMTACLICGEISAGRSYSYWTATTISAKIVSMLIQHT